MTATLPTTAADLPPAGGALPGDGVPGSPRRPTAETIRLYAADWNAFLDCCKGEGVAALPAAPATVAAFLQRAAATLSAGALARLAAAIAAQHRQAGLTSPAADPAVSVGILLHCAPVPTPRASAGNQRGSGPSPYTKVLN